MTDRELERIVYREPFIPFLLRLQDGEEVTVARPRNALVSGGYVAVFGISRPRGGATRQGLRLIRADRIATVQPLAAHDGGDGSEVTAT